MENKEVEKALNNIREGVFCDGDTDSIKEYIEQLEEQIELKNKALDNACRYIQEIGFNPDWGGIPQCEKCDYLNSPSVCWDCEGRLKKMFEGVGCMSNE